MVPADKARVRRNPLTRRWAATCPCGLSTTLNAHWLALLIATKHTHVQKVIPNQRRGR